MSLQLPALFLLLFLETIALHLGSGGRRAKAFSAAALILLQGAVAWRLGFGELSLYTGAAGFFLVAFALAPLALGPPPRQPLLILGYLALALLLGLTFWVRAELGVGFDWYRVLSELPFTARYNWGQGLLPWVQGFFQDDFMKFFWWTIAVLLVAGTFLYRAHAGPPAPPPRAAKQLPLYAPRRTARRRR